MYIFKSSRLILKNRKKKARILSSSKIEYLVTEELVANLVRYTVIKLVASSAITKSSSSLTITIYLI